jgi:hypothetical protein
VNNSTALPLSSPTESSEVEGAAVSRSHAKLRGLFLLALCVAALSGCKSRFVEASILNQGPPIHVMEFDYPSASFGANMLASGATFHYRFKVQGPGPLSLQYEDGEGHAHTATGPHVDLGDEGSLLVTISPTGAVTWTPSLSNPK